jgi:hypothetical protein
MNKVTSTILPSSSRRCYSCNIDDSGTTTIRSIDPRVLYLKLWYMYHYWYAEDWYRTLIKNPSIEKYRSFKNNYNISLMYLLTCNITGNFI